MEIELDFLLIIPQLIFLGRNVDRLSRRVTIKNYEMYFEQRVYYSSIDKAVGNDRPTSIKQFRVVAADTPELIDARVRAAKLEKVSYFKSNK